MLILIIIAFGIYEISMYFKNRKINTYNSQKPLIVKDIIQTDGNNNGIPDWEESLWGFDPYKNGPENKEAIMAKKRQIAQNNEAENPGAQESALTENDNISREFFALVMSLQGTGNLNDASANSITDAISSKLKPSPLPDLYTDKDQSIKITTKKDDVISYLKSVKSLIEKHGDLGKELIYISQGAETSDQTTLDFANEVATSYKLLAKDLIKIPVPNKLALTILSITNNYDKIGKSTEGLSKILENPMVAMNSLLNYKKYCDELSANLDGLSKNI